MGADREKTSRPPGTLGGITQDGSSEIAPETGGLEVIGGKRENPVQSLRRSANGAHPVRTPRKGAVGISGTMSLRHPCSSPGVSAAKGVSSAILQRSGRPGESRWISTLVGTPRSRLGSRSWRHGEGKKARDRSRSDAGTDPGIRTSKTTASQRTETGKLFGPIRPRLRRLGPPRSHRP